MKRGSSGLNLLLGVDKPAGMTSHDVVNRVRRALGERRVGHAGTLDPMATGVMVVGVGQGTRLMGHLTSETKSYVARIVFGTETNTDDAEGEVTRTATVGARLADASYAKDVLAELMGEQLQVPPAFSAISVNGERAYARARAGEDVELAPRPVVVYEASLLHADDAEDVCWTCAFTVSKGTYIRALARDLGRSVGSAAHLGELRRTASGSVTLAACSSLEDVQNLGAMRIREVMLDPVASLGMPAYEVRDHELPHVMAGRAFVPSSPLSGRGDSFALVRNHTLLGIWVLGGARLRPRVNFPQPIEGVRA